MRVEEHAEPVEPSRSLRLSRTPLWRSPARRQEATSSLTTLALQATESRSAAERYVLLQRDVFQSVVSSALRDLNLHQVESSGENSLHNMRQGVVCIKREMPEDATRNLKTLENRLVYSRLSNSGESETTLNCPQSEAGVVAHSRVSRRKSSQVTRVPPRKPRIVRPWSNCMSATSAEDLTLLRTNASQHTNANQHTSHPLRMPADLVTRQQLRMVAGQNSPLDLRTSAVNFLAEPAPPHWVAVPRRRLDDIVESFVRTESLHQHRKRRCDQSRLSNDSAGISLPINRQRNWQTPLLQDLCSDGQTSGESSPENGRWSPQSSAGSCSTGCSDRSGRSSTSPIRPMLNGGEASQCTVGWVAVPKARVHNIVASLVGEPESKQPGNWKKDILSRVEREISSKTPSRPK